MVYKQQPPELKSCGCLTQPFFIVVYGHLTSSFAVIIISTATRGHHPTINTNMGDNKLLAQLNFMVVFLMMNAPMASTL